MEGRLLGSYRLGSELGSGGMGTVYRATVEGESAAASPGESVAVKVVHPHLLSRPGVLERFRQEGEIGRRVAHENVVRTLAVDSLELDGAAVHFLVMEYVAGRTLRTLLQDLGCVPEALLRELARQTAAGLAAIHEAGIIHRDLKPENILVTEDHRVRIMDLGIARLVEQSVALTLEGQFAGSLYYAAPEQFSSAKIGPAVDLYSLGVVLYELATGENPFRRDLATAAMAAHLELVPEPLNRRSQDLSEFLADVVANLLAKRPEDRPESAVLLHRVFAEAERSAWWWARERAILERQVRMPRIPVRRETEIHGRAEPLDRLRAAWRRARAGEGRTVLLEGEAGIGKTRVLDDFLLGLKGEDLRILYGSYPPSGGSGGLSDGILDHFGEGRLGDALARYLTVTPRLIPAFEAYLRHEVPPAGSEVLGGDALHAVMVHLLRGMAGEKPLLWIVDDLQFAERESRQIVLSLARALGEHPVLLVVATRPGIPDDEITNFSRLSNFGRITLPRLGARDVIELLRDAFRSEVLADRLGAKIAWKSDGVPLFVFEMIRGLRDGRLIEELPDGSFVETRFVEEIEVPSAVRDLIAGRLLDLSKEERDLLDVAAVQGFEFDAGLVADVLAREKIVVLQALAEIERRTGVIRSGGGQCRFDHHQIQEVLHEDLMDELRLEYHARVAEMTAERAGGGEGLKDQSVYLFAWHHLNGSRPGSAADHLFPALEYLKHAYRTDAAAALGGLALASPGLVTGAARLELLLLQIGHLATLGRIEEETAAIDEAVVLVEREARPDLRGRVGLAQAGHLVRRGLYDEGRSTLERTAADAREDGETEIEADVAGVLGSISRSQGRFEEAIGHYERSRELGLRLGARRVVASAHGGLGLVLQSMGRYEEAREEHECWLAAARESGDLKSEAFALMNLGSVRWFQGKKEEAIDLQKRAIALLREIGDRVGEATAMGNLGISIQAQGRYEEARRYHERLLGITREIGDVSAEAVCHGCLGNESLQLGRIAAAREHYERWLAITCEIGNRPSEGVSRLALGGLFGYLGDQAASRDFIRRAREIMHEIGARREEAYAIHSLGLLAEREGDPERAVAVFQEALALRREIDYPAGIATTLTALGRIEVDCGNREIAAAYLEEALDLSRAQSLRGEIVVASAAASKLPGGDGGPAIAALEEFEETLTPIDRMQASFLLFESGGDVAWLGEAHRLLTILRDHAPEEYRERMVENVPLHRAIARAWEERGGGSADSESAIR